MGTLKSTLIKTRLPERSTSVIDNLLAMDMVVDDGESQEGDDQRQDQFLLLTAIMEAGSTPAPGNSLGLDIEIQNLSIGDDGTIPVPEPSEQPPKDGTTDATKKAEKKKPYVNMDRHMTGSNPRVKTVLISLTEQIYNLFVGETKR